MHRDPPAAAVAVTLADWIERLPGRALPAAVTRAVADSLIDTAGLAVAARGADYVAAVRESWTGTGPSTIIGSPERRPPEAAAMINGTAAHGEDFDNTFEGCPVHPGAVVVPAALAVAEAEGLTGPDLLRGLAAGHELMCRLGLAAGKATHAAGFHPTAVIGAMGASAAVAAATRAPAAATVDAFGIAGSMASGIIEYLTDGSWTKRMHAGWAAHAGLRAVAMGRAGFRGPATVFEGVHGFLKAFAPGASPATAVLTEGLGQRWETARIAFKPYACGTMTQPFIDCAIRLRARGVRAGQVAQLICPVGEGTVHRLWEPLDLKRNPPNGYAAKFSTPYCIAVALVRGDAGLAAFGPAAVRDPEVRALSNRVVYRIDPHDEYPSNYAGCIRAVLNDGAVVEERQPHLRGGAREPLGRDALIRKCAANLDHAGVDPRLAAAIAEWADGLERDTAAGRPPWS